ncbi:hypothetical protein CS544_02615 [Porphyromonas gingivalis]|uniref:Uncharacterized protein n=1 Tax=Porphyromonas phage phage026a_KCOM2802 TaxID=3154116 RepID=A0AAT9JFM8_9CAUD|nr:hypothetical protein [Porphyromonas gingivalis]ATR90093.1 hypothetical protein CS544_02615 [Porphyromonas gingivalis]
MQIRLVSGEAFDLPTDFTIDISRVNPFFAEYGEHSIPVTLPPTPTNTRLLGFPGDIGVGAQRSRYDVSLEDGAFFFPAKMVLLSANADEGYECSFVLNLGKLYASMQTDKLSNVVEKQYTRLDFGTAEAAMLYLETIARKAEMSDDDILDVFPVLSDRHILNEYGYSTPSPGFVFSACKERHLQIDGEMTVIPATFLLTPFLRLRPLLLHIFRHYGYSVADWGVLDEAPFRDLVLLNNNYDSIVNGYVIPLQLAPDCDVVELLSAVEGKFMSRWVADESASTVRFVRFDSLLEAENTDLSAQLVGGITYSYPAKYKRVELKSSYVKPVFPQGIDAEGYEQIENLKEVLRKRKGLCMDPRTGILYRYMVMRDMYGKLLTIGSIITNYIDEHKDYEAEVIDCCDTVPAMQLPLSAPAFQQLAIPQIGEGRWLNSFCRLSDGKTSAGEDKGTLPIILAMPVSGQGVLRQGGLIDTATQRSLIYNGSNGLFDRYYRRYDELLKHGLVEADAPVQLRGIDKMNLSSVKPIVIAGNRYLPESLDYSTMPGSSSTLKLRSLVMRQHLSASSEFYLSSVEFGASVDKSMNDLPRHTWAIELRWQYYVHETPPHGVVFYDDDMPECEAIYGNVGVSAPSTGDQSADPYHWGQAYQPLYDAFKQRGDRVVAAPTPEQIATGKPYVYASSLYNTGLNPMPQPIPGGGGGLDPIDPPPIATGKYFVIYFCLRAKEL